MCCKNRIFCDTFVYIYRIYSVFELFLILHGLNLKLALKCFNFALILGLLQLCLSGICIIILYKIITFASHDNLNDVLLITENVKLDEIIYENVPMSNQRNVRRTLTFVLTNCQNIAKLRALKIIHVYNYC